MAKPKPTLLPMPATGPAPNGRGARVVALVPLTVRPPSDDTCLHAYLLHYRVNCGVGGRGGGHEAQFSVWTHSLSTDKRIRTPPVPVPPFVIGGIQALRGNGNDCAIGVATQDSTSVGRLHVGTGLQRPQDLKPWLIMKRVSAMEICSYADIDPQLTGGQPLTSPGTTGMSRAWESASPARF